MEAVLGLVPGRGLRAVEDVGGDLFAEVRGQAVQDDCLRVGEPEQLGVDAVAGEVAGAPLLLVFLALLVDLGAGKVDGVAAELLNRRSSSSMLWRCETGPVLPMIAPARVPWSLLHEAAPGSAGVTANGVEEGQVLLSQGFRCLELFDTGTFETAVRESLGALRREINPEGALA